MSAMANAQKRQAGPNSPQPGTSSLSSFPALSNWAHLLNLVYVGFLVTHVPVIFSVDLVSLYPAWLRTGWMLQLRNFYIETYKDRFFIDPPSWFLFFVSLELLYHFPVTLWLVPALLKNDPRTRIHLLLFGFQVTLTTSACVVDQWFNPSYSKHERNALMGLYLGYMVVPAIMMIDGYAHLWTRLSPPAVHSPDARPGPDSGSDDKDKLGADGSQETMASE